MFWCRLPNSSTSRTLLTPNASLLQPQVICFALSFMETLGQGGAGTCKSMAFLWHKPTAPCQNNEFLSTPHHPGRMWFYMQSEPEVCADSGGGRALFTFHPAALGLLFPGPLCYSPNRNHGETLMGLNVVRPGQKHHGSGAMGAFCCSGHFSKQVKIKKKICFNSGWLLKQIIGLLKWLDYRGCSPFFSTIVPNTSYSLVRKIMTQMGIHMVCHSHYSPYNRYYIYHKLPWTIRRRRMQNQPNYVHTIEIKIPLKIYIKSGI